MDTNCKIQLWNSNRWKMLTVLDHFLTKKSHFGVIIFLSKIGNFGGNLKFLPSSFYGTIFLLSHFGDPYVVSLLYIFPSIYFVWNNLSYRKRKNGPVTPVPNPLPPQTGYLAVGGICLIALIKSWITKLRMIVFPACPRDHRVPFRVFLSALLHRGSFQGPFLMILSVIDMKS